MPPPQLEARDCNSIQLCYRWPWLFLALLYSTQERTTTISLSLACSVPQYSFFLSESAFVIPKFTYLLTTRICMKVYATAHSKIWHFILFSNLGFFISLKPSGQELLICLGRVSYYTTFMTETKLLARFFLQALHLILTGTKLSSSDQLKKKNYKGRGRAETREKWSYVKISNIEKKPHILKSMILSQDHYFCGNGRRAWKRRTRDE